MDNKNDTELLEEVKSHLKITWNEEDEDIAKLILERKTALIQKDRCC